MANLEQFFIELDAALEPRSGPRTELRLIGSSALMLQTLYRRGTKDADILETAELDASIRAELLRLGGPSSRLARRHLVHLELVAGGVPFLPMSARFRELAAFSGLQRLAVRALDVVDVVVAKLKRFHAADRSDIQAMVELGLVDPAEFVERFRSAVDRFSGDARAEDLPKYLKNFHIVERDFLDVKETEIDLPDWI